MDTKKANELPIPPAAEADDAAVELTRVWAAGGKQHVSLATGIWQDAAAWGLMLVDLARHIAIAYAQAEDLDPQHVLSRIKEGFDAEWENPTDEVQGHLVD